VPKSLSGRLTIWAVAALLVSTTWVFARAPEDSSKPELPKVTRLRNPQPTYKVEVGLGGEIFPVFANYASLETPSQRKWGTIAVTVSNPTDHSLEERFSVRVLGWSDVEIQTAVIQAGGIRTLLFAPVFNQRLYQNHEIAAATADVTVRDSSNNVVFAANEPVRLRSVDDMFWGKDFQDARFVASWVTPHDPIVVRLLARAKKFAPGRRLPGYEPNKSVPLQQAATYAQAKAIYRALQAEGFSYVKSSFTLGGNRWSSERIRMPGESLKELSANCIDGVVLYASLFENLGMDPVVVLVPGHSYVGVRTAAGSDQFLYIDTSLTGRSSFEVAVSSAERGLERRNPSEIVRVDVSAARLAGVYPMPLVTGEEAGVQNAQLRKR